MAELTERDPDKRCVSSSVEKPGHTHWCRLTRGHTADHICVCSRKWERAVPREMER